ncbi:hypothetical protein BDFG_06011 [Blastomyces dermatitidis ATCC 26199]|nr:hypothetical protein BDFG_06011 [Blastomyces dermatitidis ATCC 26199]
MMMVGRHSRLVGRTGLIVLLSTEYCISLVSLKSGPTEVPPTVACGIATLLSCERRHLPQTIIIRCPVGRKRSVFGYSGELRWIRRVHMSPTGEFSDQRILPRNPGPMMAIDNRWTVRPSPRNAIGTRNRFN